MEGDTFRDSGAAGGTDPGLVIDAPILDRWGEESVPVSERQDRGTYTERDFLGTGD